MKMLVKRMTRVNRSGIGKTGKPYTIDQTVIAVALPFDDVDGFGQKEMEYRFGDHTKFTPLEKYRGKLPLELDIELTTQLDQYGNPVTVIGSINDLSPVPASKMG